MGDLKFHGPDTEIGKAYDFLFSRLADEEDKANRVFQGVYGNVAIYEVVGLDDEQG